MKRFEKVSAFFAELLVTVGMLPVTAFAENETAANDGRGNSLDAKNIIANLGSNESVNSIIKPITGIFGSVYDILWVAGVTLLVIGVILVAIGFFVHGSNASKREDSKARLFYIFGAAAGVGGAVNILAAILKIGASI